MLNTKIPDCQACSLRDAYTPLGGLWVTSYNTPPALEATELVVVIDRPTTEEALIESRFSDRSNTYLKKLLSSECKSTYYMTYLTKCYNQLTKSAYKKQSTTCIDEWLNKEIAGLKPKAILCLGELVHAKLMKNICGKNAFSKDVGTMYIRPDNSILTCYYSANYLLNHGKKAEIEFRDFLTKLNNAMETINVQPIKEVV